MDDLDLGICPLPVLEKRQGTQSIICAVARLKPAFAAAAPTAVFCLNCM